jgi:hypothetical protein
VPATVSPVVDECTHQLFTAVDGTVSPLTCPGNMINVLAWQYYGQFATAGQIDNAFCYDVKKGNIETVPKEDEVYQISTLYYGWQFALPPHYEDSLKC